MAAREKTLERMRANPRDWRIENLEAIARHHGFVVRKPGGSHAIFTQERCTEMLSVPA